MAGMQDIVISESAPEGAPPPELAAADAALTVLVADDEPSNLRSLRKIFEREQMRVLTAENAKSALDLVRRHRTQVALIDVMMPGTSGTELLRALREVSPETEVVLMTAYGTVEIAVQAM